MLDKTKIINGPFNLILMAAAVEIYTITGLKKDALALGVENQVEELEDGSEDFLGRLLTAEATFSQLNGADLTSIEDDTVDSVVVEFPSKNKTVTIAAPGSILASVDNLKTKITIKKFASSKVWDDLFTIT
ncbi:MAG: hypothetical protein K9N34_03665 [Candidatus Marinimicrobia bacterium]|nr:hypothetical protein [Candidatus Neomarinimicrobiota bacterium]MCF7839792.1 hypothetical protein [Candidatus Neomarinimicrobiota bacterium]